ncbi:hypothetical protein CRUP_021678, partial [Coryphaenoides rupestris]
VELHHGPGGGVVLQGRARVLLQDGPDLAGPLDHQAVLEADDVDLHLRPLRRLIGGFEERSFPRVESLLPPLFHTLCLVWSRSRYYCRPQRMVVLLQEFCNMLIEKAIVYLIPEELFKMELEEGVERVHTAISALRAFKRLFHDHRRRIPRTVCRWPPPGVELFACALDFLKLERVELGGSRGKLLGEMVFSMNEEFHDRWRALRESKYDPLDYTKEDFLRNYRRFMEQSKDFDQRLGTVLNLAFQHTKGLESTLKLLQIFGTLLERPTIHRLFSPNYGLLLAMFDRELDHCQTILDQHRKMLREGSAVLGKNLPEAADVFRKCERLLEVLDRHDEELLSEWTLGLAGVCGAHLREPLLRLEPDTGLFRVNFDP